MFKFLRTTKQSLVDETTLSRFVHRASSAEKRRVYSRVIREAADEQREVLKTVHERKSQKSPAHA